MLEGCYIGRLVWYVNYNIKSGAVPDTRCWRDIILGSSCGYIMPSKLMVIVSSCGYIMPSKLMVIVGGSCVV